MYKPQGTGATSQKVTGSVPEGVLIVLAALWPLGPDSASNRNDYYEYQAYVVGGYKGG